ncbi:protein CBFA2T3-like [Lampetra planeri]
MSVQNSTLSIEDFHGKLQEATNFPLRPFVIPFLKANLPLLQRELLHCARLAKLPPAQYLSTHQHLLLELGGLVGAGVGGAPQLPPMPPAHPTLSSVATPNGGPCTPAGTPSLASPFDSPDLLLELNESGKRRGGEHRWVGGEKRSIV